MSLPIRVRLTAWYVLLLSSILAAMGGFVLLRLKSDLVAGLDRSLETRVAQISLGYQGGGEGEFQDVSDAALMGLAKGESGAQLLSPRGVVVESSGDAVAVRPMVPPDVAAAAIGGQRVQQTAGLGPDREPFRVLAIPAPQRAGGGVLVVVDSLEQVDHSVHQVLVLMLLAGPVAIAAAAAGGWRLARRALLPVARMTREAAEIGVDRLDERVAVPRTSDELGRLAQTLNGMLERLEQGVEEKRRFVADASHELRTPLAVMRSELEVSLRSGDLSPVAREVLESAFEEVERMGRLVDNLLTLARIDEGALQLLREPMDLGDSVRGVAADLRSLADSQGVRLVVEAQPVAGPVLGDRERLGQAVTNLMDNAIKFTGLGGVVRAAVWLSDDEAGLRVSDTGPGIPKDVLPRVFDRFFRVSMAQSRVEGGSGLGLAICREIAHAHGGRVWVESEVGRGSSFFLALPRVPAEHPVAIASLAEVPGGRRKGSDQA